MCESCRDNCCSCYQGFDKQKFSHSQIYLQLISVVAGIIGYYAVQQSLKDFGDLKEAFTNHDRLFTSPSIIDMTAVEPNEKCPSDYESVSSTNVKPNVYPGCYCYFNNSCGKSMPPVKVDDSTCSNAVQNDFNLSDCFFFQVNDNQTGKNYETFFGKKICIQKGAPSFSDLIDAEMAVYFGYTNCSDETSLIAKDMLRLCPNGYSNFPITDIAGYYTSTDLFYNEFIDNRTIAFGDYFTQQSYYTEYAAGKLYYNVSLKDEMLVFARNQGWGFWPLQAMTIARNRPCLESEEKDYFTNEATFARYSPFLVYNSVEQSRKCSAENHGYYLVDDNDEISELYYVGDIDVKFWNNTGIEYSSDESIDKWQFFSNEDFYSVPNIFDENFNIFIDLTTYNGLYVQTAGIFNVNNFYRCSQFFEENYDLITYLYDAKRTLSNLKESGELNGYKNDILYNIAIATLAYKSFLSFVMIILNIGCVWRAKWCKWCCCDWESKEQSPKSEKNENCSKILDFVGIFIDWVFNCVMFFLFLVILEELKYQKGELEKLLGETEILNICWRSDILYTIKLTNYSKVGDLIDNYKLPWISCFVTMIAGAFYILWPVCVVCYYKCKCREKCCCCCACCCCCQEEAYKTVKQAESATRTKQQIEVIQMTS